MAQNHAAQINQEVHDTATRRAGRTLIQIVVSLILMGVFDVAVRKYTDYAPDEWRPVAAGVWLLIVTTAQNYAENHGIIPPILGTKANVRANQV